MAVDAHIHLIPIRYKTELERRALFPHVLPNASDEQVNTFLDCYGLDAAVLSPVPSGVWFGDPGVARYLARMLNEEIAAVVSHEPARRGGLGILPLPDVDAAVAETAFALDELGLDGILLLTNIDGVYVGDPAWDDLYEELERRSAYVFVHPTTAPADSSSTFPPWLLDFPFDTTRAVATMLFADFPARFPRLRIQLSHLGGTVPFLAHRLASLGQHDPAYRARTPQAVLDDVAWFFYDTGQANHAAPVEATCSHVPFEHIVFGSDWPFVVLPERPDFAAELDELGSERRAALEDSHIGALVPRLAAARR